MFNRPQSLPLFVVSLLFASTLLLWVNSDCKELRAPFGDNPADPIQRTDENHFLLRPSTTITAMTPTSSSTKTPIATIIPAETRRPIPTPETGSGEALTIGYSIEGRPLEVVRFGQGARSLLIIAGVHGGYEWNTVALADQLSADRVPEKSLGMDS